MSMGREHILWSTCTILLASAMQAQVLIDAPIELTAPSPSGRQVLGLSDHEPNSLLSAGHEVSGIYRTAETTWIGGIWQASVPAWGTSLAPGAHLVLIPAEGGEGDVLLSVNGLPAAPVIFEPGWPVTSGDWPQATPLSVVYDGSSWQVMNGTGNAPRPCPDGLVAIDRNYCMEVAEHDSVFIHDAAVACRAAGLRLCRWSEWFLGCEQHGVLGLANMLNGHEWINDTANEEGYFRVMGHSSSHCRSVANKLGATTRIRYRCCYSR